MSDELAVGGVVTEVISLFAAAEDEAKPRKVRAKAKSKATAGCSPGLRPVRNDKRFGEGADPGRDGKLDSSPGLRPAQNDRAYGEGSRPTPNERDLRAMTSKELGEMAEAEFLRRALAMKIGVAKPWGESRAYDFIVDDEGTLNRVQVKAAFSEGRQGSYSLRAYRSSKRSYTKKDIDVMAGYVNAKDAWYLFPVRVIRKLRSLKLFPASKKRRSKHEKWREAWWVIRK